MIFYIYNPQRGHENPLYECEIYWDEKQMEFFADAANRIPGTGEYKSVWNLDLHCDFYAAELMREHRNQQWDNLPDDEYEELICDIDAITHFRSWMWEKAVLNSKIDKFRINAPESQFCEKYLEDHCRKYIEAFAKKYGFETYED